MSRASDVRLSPEADVLFGSSAHISSGSEGENPRCIGGPQAIFAWNRGPVQPGSGSCLARDAQIRTSKKQRSALANINLDTIIKAESSCATSDHICSRPSCASNRLIAILAG
jgi:hypothetical protein